jgi:hypothetical protein
MDRTTGNSRKRRGAMGRAHDVTPSGRALIAAFERSQNAGPSTAATKMVSNFLFLEYFLWF